MNEKELEKKCSESIIRKYYVVIWSYDNFQYEYEENPTEHENAIDALKELLKEKEENKDFQKCLGEPKLYLRIRKCEETEDTIYVTDYNIRKYKNRYFLKRAEDII